MKTVCETLLYAVQYRSEGFGASDYPPEDLASFKEWLDAQTARIPAEYRESASIEFAAVRGEHVAVAIRYDRPMAQVEIEADNRTAEQLAAHVEKCKRIAWSLPPVAVDPLPYAMLAEHLRDILSAPPKYVAVREAMTVGYGDQNMLKGDYEQFVARAERYRK